MAIDSFLNNVLRRHLLGLGLLNLGLLSVLFVTDTRYAASALSPATVVQTDQKFPVRLRIPSIAVNASIDYVGVTADGAMDAPKDPANVAWLVAGTRPGDVGSAVIGGHYGWEGAQPAAFDNLHELRVGDLIYVDDKEETVTVFVVREMKTYREDESAQQVFNSVDGKAHLNLITCEGIWNASKNSYPSRLVVFSDKI